MATTHSAESSLSSTPVAEFERTPPAAALAGLMAGAALIHFVMAPIHASSSQVEAALFAAAGWAQAIIAVLLLVRPRRAAMSAGVAVNLAILAVWAYSRIKGLPFGAHANVAESVETVDLAAALLEGVFVVGAAGALLNRAPVRAPAFASMAFGGAALGIASMVIISPTTATHAHNDAPSAIDATTASLNTIESQRCDKGINPKAYWNETAAAGIDNVFGQGHLVDSPPAAGAGPASGHDHGAPVASTAPATVPVPDASREATSQKESRLAQLSSGVGEANDAALVVELSKISDAEYEAWLTGLHTNASAHAHASGAPDDNGGHGGHIGPNSWVAITDGGTCEVLQRQLDLARDTALSYPTAADAKAAGWVRVTGYVPGIAAHYMNFKYVDDAFEVDKPEMILYDGDGDDARVVGLSYYILKDGEQEPTIGFAGGNDHYHRHVGLCVGRGGVIGDTQTTEEDCAARGGVKQSGGAGWMSHAWVVPGCESPWGMFSGANPILENGLREASGTNDGGCSASSVRQRYDLSPGENEPAVGSDTETARDN